MTTTDRATPATAAAALALHRADTATEEVLVAVGEVGPAQRGAFFGQVVAAASTGDHDLLLDARAVTAFDDDCLQALTSARSHARHRGHRVAVLDGEHGQVLASLRRTGLLELFPVFADPATAAAALAEARAVLVRAYMPLEPRWRARLSGDEDAPEAEPELPG